MEENPLALVSMDDLLQEIANRTTSLVIAFEVHLDADRVFCRNAFKGSPAVCLGLGAFLVDRHRERARHSMDRQGFDDSRGDDAPPS